MLRKLYEKKGLFWKSGYSQLIIIVTAIMISAVTKWGFSNVLFHILLQPQIKNLGDIN